MRNRFSKRENIFKRTVLSSKLFSILALIVIILIAYPFVKKINQQRILNREIRELEEEVGRVEDKNKDLRELIDYLGSDSFAEKEARSNLDLKKPGEKVVIVKGVEEEIENKEDIESVFIIPGLDKGTEAAGKTNSQKWWAYFFSTNFQ